MKKLFMMVLLAVATTAMAQKVGTWVPDHSALESNARTQVAKAAQAEQEELELILTAKTHRYETYGQGNNVQLSMMCAVGVGQSQIEVDFGYGRVAHTITSDGVLDVDTTTEVVTGGTSIAGSVSPAGIVRVYGKASDIDYLDFHGSEIYDIDISKMTNLAILELGHNQISRLDLTGMPNMEYLDLKDNPFENGLFLGDFARLKYLNLNQLGDHAFDHAEGMVDLTKYAALRIFTAWDTHGLRSLDPSQCTYLQQLSVDNTNLSTLDVTKNEYLMILNISDTKINSIDLSGNPNLVEFYAANEGQMDVAAKFKEIDLSANPLLQRIFLDGNALTTLDVSKQWNLISLYAANNKLTSIKGVDIEKELPENRPVELAYLDLSGNYFTYATLPIVEPMTYFYYDLQHDLPTAKEYGVCEEGKLDLTPWIEREGSENAIAMALLSRDGFSWDQQLFEGVDYTFDPNTNIVEFLTAHEDSVQIAIFNTVFTDVTLLTGKFLVRSAANYGKPVELFNLEAKSGSFTMQLATAEDETLYVDFGDGERKEFATSAGVLTTISGTASGKVTVYGRVAAVVKELEMKNQSLLSLDVNKQTNMARLVVRHCGLDTIDLGWNHCLRSIDLSGNAIAHLNLGGENNAFNKNLLTEVKVNGNGMQTLDLGLAAATIVTLDASDNKLTEIELDEMYYLRQLNLSNNLLTELNVSECESLEQLLVSGNQLRTLDVAANKQLSELDIANNQMTFRTIAATIAPLSLERMTVTYAPQQEVKIPAVSMAVNLRSEAEVNGVKTIFKWENAVTHAVLTEGVDYTIENGVTTFLPSVENQLLSCTMVNAALPRFVAFGGLRTTATTAIKAPKYTIAEFDTPKGGQYPWLSLAATEPDTYIYIDWGDNNLVEYPLQTTYTLFNLDSLVSTTAGAHVKVYSNVSETGNVRVFSVAGFTMSNVSINKMTDLYCLALEGSGLESIDLSGLEPKLGELNLAKNKLKTIDLTGFKNLYYLVLSDNQLTNITLDEKNNISWFMAAKNKLTTVDNMPLSHVFNLDLTGNSIASLDLSKMKNVGQLMLSNNKLHELDITPCYDLRVLDITTNYFDYTTLPIPGDILIYNYSNQAPIEVACVDGVIDLSKHAVITDPATGEKYETEFYFFEGAISIYEDESGSLVLDNYEFTEGEEFFVKNGLISFAEDQKKVTGLLINELFPEILLYTKTIAVKGGAQGIENVTATEKVASGAYNLLGIPVSTDAKGIIIVNGEKRFNP